MNTEKDKTTASASQNREPFVADLTQEAPASSHPPLGRKKPTPAKPAHTKGEAPWRRYKNVKTGEVTYGRNTKPAHTPGPWSTTEQGLFVRSEHARICTMTTANPNSDESHDERAANAKLIAAAPETAAERDRLREERDTALQERNALRDERREFATSAVKAERDTFKRQYAASLEVIDTITAERDRLRLELDEAQRAYTYDTAQLKQERDQAREQVKTLLKACKGSLNDINTARRHVFTGSTANLDDMTFDAIENTLEPATRELHAAIASIENAAKESEGQ